MAKRGRPAGSLLYEAALDSILERVTRYPQTTRSLWLDYNAKNPSTAIRDRQTFGKYLAKLARMGKIDYTAIGKMTAWYKAVKHGNLVPNTPNPS